MCVKSDYSCRTEEKIKKAQKILNMSTGIGIKKEVCPLQLVALYIGPS